MSNDTTSISSRSTRVIAEGYTLVRRAPDTASYLKLRKDSGLSSRTEAQAIAALEGSYECVHVSYNSTGEIVGMGRVFGDGGWYFVIADMAVLPDHQRRGLGDVMLESLLESIRIRAPAGGAYVSLMADVAGRKLYAKHGFVHREDQLGMMKILE